MVKSVLFPGTNALVRAVNEPSGFNRGGSNLAAGTGRSADEADAPSFCIAISRPG